MPTKAYLGDGVYVDMWPEVDGGLILTTENGIETTNRIYLEPQTIIALSRYLRIQTERK